MSNGIVDPLAAQAGLPPFPTWPPPSGGYPNVTPELGPITNPFPYGTPQPANISTANPYPPGGIWKGTFYPQKMPTGANGQNQSPPPGWPAWPYSRLSAGSSKACVLPDKASPSISQIP